MTPTPPAVFEMRCHYLKLCWQDAKTAPRSCSERPGPDACRPAHGGTRIIRGDGRHPTAGHPVDSGVLGSELAVRRTLPSGLSLRDRPRLTPPRSGGHVDGHGHGHAYGKDCGACWPVARGHTHHSSRRARRRRAGSPADSCVFSRGVRAVTGALGAWNPPATSGPFRAPRALCLEPRLGVCVRSACSCSSLRRSTRRARR